MKLLRSISVVAASLFAFCFLLSTTAIAVDPFPPFSTEGNPDEKYLMTEIFPLFRYIKPPSLKVFENRDRSRDYQDLEVCANGDRRDYDCDNVDDGCDGGDVDVCFKGVRRGQVAYTAHSDSGSCSANSQDPPGTKGRCRYVQRPRVNGELKATDFSANNNTPASGTTDTTTPPVETSPTDPAAAGVTGTIGSLTYPKLQNEALRFGNIGNDNAITWGSHYLGLTQCERIVKQAMVLERAVMTKNTVRTTGEWPLGWVDWGYKTPNGKTLNDIRGEIPGSVAGPIKVIVEATDDFFLNSGNLLSPMDEEKKQVCDVVTTELAKPKPAVWATDLTQSPIYPPSFRQGYARGSICVFDLCCPGLFCPFPEELLGNARALYADISVSQAFGAALDDLLLHHPLKEAIRIYRRLVASNQLIRFAGAAGEQAIPSRIHERLSREISDPCFKYVPGPDDFTFGWFGFHMDYVQPGSFLDPGKQCPNWGIQPEKTKEKAGAFPTESVLAKIINLIWGHPEDEVSPVKRHLITIPDAMGQSLSEIENPVFQLRDTRSELASQNEYNDTLSNVVDATSDFYYAGKGLPVGDAKRRLAYFSCNDPDYSQPATTGIEAYALGTRIGCYNELPPAAAEANCDPNVPDQNLDGLVVEEGKRYTDNLFAGCTGNSQWMQCHNDVIKRAKESGVDPLFSLAIWIHESGASNYECGREYTGGIAVQDFGINLTEIAENFTAQIVKFLGLPTAYSSCGETMQNFISKFWFGKCYSETSTDQKNQVSRYISELNTIVSIIAPGKPLVSWPQVGPYVPSNPTPGNPGTSSPPPGSTPAPSAGTPGTVTQSIDPSGACGTGYVDTALGCLPYNRDALTAALLRFLAGISGLIALVSMMIGTFLVMTAGGNSEQAKKGREIFMAGLTGLLFVIFAVTLLRIIAGTIIKLPGF